MVGITILRYYHQLLVIVLDVLLYAECNKTMWFGPGTIISIITTRLDHGNIHLGSGTIKNIRHLNIKVNNEPSLLKKILLLRD